MRRFVLCAAVTILCIAGGSAMATEEAPYRTVRSDGIFEIRRYEPQILAETVVEGTLEEAGNRAFRPLFRFISGANGPRTEIAMTAPVTQRARGEEIPMTAPVVQAGTGGRWTVAFVMPSRYTMETLPAPEDPKVEIRPVPARSVAAVRYSGTWSEARYRKFLGKLEAWMRENRLTPGGEPEWARYNPPYTLWFLRRNEILIPLAEAGTEDGKPGS